jgi:hypothetical protein
MYQVAEKERLIMVQEVICSPRVKCSHRYPAQVKTLERGRRRAQCLNCDTLGPMRATMGEAMNALREVR